MFNQNILISPIHDKQECKNLLDVNLKKKTTFKKNELQFKNKTVVMHLKINLHKSLPIHLFEKFNLIR